MHGGDWHLHSSSSIVHGGHWHLSPCCRSSMVETGPTLILIDRCTWWALAAPPLFVGIDGRGGWTPPAPPLPLSMVVHGGHWLLPLSSSSSIVGGWAPVAPPLLVVDRAQWVPAVPPLSLSSSIVHGGHRRLLPSSGCLHSPASHPYERGGALRALGGFYCRFQAVSNK